MFIINFKILYLTSVVKNILSTVISYFSQEFLISFQGPDSCYLFYCQDKCLFTRHPNYQSIHVSHKLPFVTSSSSQEESHESNEDELKQRTDDIPKKVIKTTTTIPTTTTMPEVPTTTLKTTPQTVYGKNFDL